MTEPQRSQSKQDIFKAELEALQQRQQDKELPLEDLINRIFSCGHCILSMITLDALEPIPADVQEKEETVTSAAIAGKLWVSWIMKKTESHDGAEYESMSVLPYKCWVDQNGAVRLREDMPLNKEDAQIVRSNRPVIMRNGKLHFAFPTGHDEEDEDFTPNELDFRMFESFESTAGSDFERLKLTLTLLTEDEGKEVAEHLLDQNFCPDKKEKFEKMLSAQVEMASLAGKMFDLFGSGIEKELAAAQAEIAAEEANTDHKAEDK